MSTAFLFIYVISLFIISSLTNSSVLIVLFVAALILFYKDTAGSLKRLLYLLGPFVFVMSLATVVYYLLKTGRFDRWDILLNFNLRAGLMAHLSFVFLRRVNMFDAVRFSRPLTTILSMSVAQIYTYRRLLSDFYTTLKSRTIKRQNLIGSLRWAGIVSVYFMMLSIRNSKEMAEALRSRGV